VKVVIIKKCGCGHKHKKNPQLRVRGIMEIPRRKKEPPMIATGNHFWDQSILRLQVQPNGTLDAPPTWAADVSDVLLTVSADGLQCDVLADIDVAAFSVTVSAPADNPSTPELESVSQTFTGSFSHSKATSLGGSFEDIPRV
jgi:hypothetical protein